MDMDFEPQKAALLSAVIPFLNEEECMPSLIAALDDSLGRIGVPFELILVDDGSRDRSVAVAERATSDLRSEPQ